MQKVIILQGLPASGKSTYAKKLVNENPKNTIIVNRDSIREGLGKYWVPSREDLVTQIEQFIIKEALSKKYDIVIDATNLNPKFLKDIEKIIYSINSKIIIIRRHLDTSFWKCVLRDFKRGLFGGRKVGYKIIKSFYDRYYKNTKP